MDFSKQSGKQRKIKVWHDIPQVQYKDNTNADFKQYQFCSLFIFLLSFRSNCLNAVFLFPINQKNYLSR